MAKTVYPLRRSPNAPGRLSGVLANDSGQLLTKGGQVVGGGVSLGVSSIIMGDSHGAENGPFTTTGATVETFAPNVGWFNWLQAFSGGAFNLLANVAVSGKRSDEILAEQLPIAVGSPAQIVFIVGPGANDVNAGVPVQSVINNNNRIYDALIAAGKTLVLLTVPPTGTGTAAQGAARARISQAQRSYAAANRNVILIDSRVLVLDPTSATFYARSGWVRSDNAHASPRAARAIGALVWSVMSKIVTDGSYHVASQFDTKATAADCANYTTNPLLTGTGGTLNTGFTGSCPTGWQVYRAAGTPSGTVAIQARPDGFGNDIVVTGTANADGDEIGVRTNDTMFQQLQPGDVLRGEAFVSFLNNMNLFRHMLQLRVSTSVGTYIATALSNSAGSVAEIDQADLNNILLRTPSLTIPTGVSVTGANLVVTGFYRGAGGSTIRVGRGSVIKVA